MFFRDYQDMTYRSSCPVGFCLCTQLLFYTTRSRSFILLSLSFPFPRPYYLRSPNDDLLLLRPNQTTLSQPKESYHHHNSHSREYSPENSSIPLKQSLSPRSGRMLRHGSRDSSRDGQAYRITDLGDLIEDTAGERLFFSGIGVGDNNIRYGE